MLSRSFPFRFLLTMLLEGAGTQKISKVAISMKKANSIPFYSNVFKGPHRSPRMADTLLGFACQIKFKVAAARGFCSAPHKINTSGPQLSWTASLWQGDPVSTRHSFCLAVLRLRWNGAVIVWYLESVFKLQFLMCFRVHCKNAKQRDSVWQPDNLQQISLME